MNLYGQDMDDLSYPQESGLSWTLSLKDASRRFIGRAAIESFSAEQALIGLRLLERGVMRAHMNVRTARGDGEITSGTMSPTMGVSIALARVPAGSQPGDSCEVEVRGKWVRAEMKNG